MDLTWPDFVIKFCLPSTGEARNMTVSHIRCTVILRSPINFQLLEKFPDFYGTWSFSTVTTRARYWTLHLAR